MGESDEAMKIIENIINYKDEELQDLEDDILNMAYQISRNKFQQTSQLMDVFQQIQCLKVRNIQQEIAFLILINQLSNFNSQVMGSTVLIEFIEKEIFPHFLENFLLKENFSQEDKILIQLLQQIYESYKEGMNEITQTEEILNSLNDLIIDVGEINLDFFENYQFTQTQPNENDFEVKDFDEIVESFKIELQQQREMIIKIIQQNNMTLSYSKLKEFINNYKSKITQLKNIFEEYSEKVENLLPQMKRDLKKEIQFSINLVQDSKNFEEGNQQEIIENFLMNYRTIFEKNNFQSKLQNQNSQSQSIGISKQESIQPEDKTIVQSQQFSQNQLHKQISEFNHVKDENMSSNQINEINELDDLDFNDFKSQSVKEDLENFNFEDNFKIGFNHQENIRHSIIKKITLENKFSEEDILNDFQFQQHLQQEQKQSIQTDPISKTSSLKESKVDSEIQQTQTDQIKKTPVSKMRINQLKQTLREKVFSKTFMDHFQKEENSLKDSNQSFQKKSNLQPTLMRQSNQRTRSNNTTIKHSNKSHLQNSQDMNKYKSRDIIRNSFQKAVKKTVALNSITNSNLIPSKKNTSLQQKNMTFKSKLQNIRIDEVKEQSIPQPAINLITPKKEKIDLSSQQQYPTSNVKNDLLNTIKSKNFNFDDFQTSSEFVSKVFDNELGSAQKNQIENNFMKKQQIDIAQQLIPEETTSQEIEKSENKLLFNSQKINEKIHQQQIDMNNIRLKYEKQLEEQEKEFQKQKEKQEKFWKEYVNEQQEKYITKMNKQKLLYESEQQFLQNKIQSLISSNEESNQNVKRQSVEFKNRMQQEIDDLSFQLRKAENQIKNKNDEILEMKEDMNSNKIELVALQKKIKQLQDENNQSSLLRQELQDELQRKKAQVEKIDQQKKQLENQLQSVQIFQKQIEGQSEEKNKKIIKIQEQIQAFIQSQTHGIKDQIQYTQDEFSNMILIMKDEMKELKKMIEQKLNIQELQCSELKTSKIMIENLQQSMNQFKQENKHLRNQLQKESEEQKVSSDLQSILIIIRQKMKIIKQNQQIQFDDIFNTIKEIRSTFKNRNFERQIEKSLKEKLFEIQMENSKVKTQLQIVSQKIQILEKQSLNDKLQIKEKEKNEKNLQEKLLKLSSQNVYYSTQDINSLQQQVEKLLTENNALKEINEELTEKNILLQTQELNVESSSQYQKAIAIVEKLETENEFLMQNNRLILQQYQEEVLKHKEIQEKQQRENFQIKKDIVEERLRLSLQSSNINKSVKQNHLENASLSRQRQSHYQSRSKENRTIKKSKSKKMNFLGKFNLLWDMNERVNESKSLLEQMNKNIAEKLHLKNYSIFQYGRFTIRIKERYKWINQTNEVNLEILFDNKSDETVYVCNPSLNCKNKVVTIHQEFNDTLELKPFKFYTQQVKLELRGDFNINPSTIFLCFSFLDSFQMNQYMSNQDPMIIHDMQQNLILPISLNKLLQYQGIKKGQFELKNQLTKQYSRKFQKKNLEDQDIIHIIPYLTLYHFDPIRKIYGVKIQSILGQMILELVIEEQIFTISIYSIKYDKDIQIYSTCLEIIFNKDFILSN